MPRIIRAPDTDTGTGTGTVTGEVWLAPVLVSTNTVPGNITLSGLQSVDGIMTVAGDRVLVKNQTALAENGIYVASSGAWSRAADADTAAKLRQGTKVLVLGGFDGKSRVLTQLEVVTTLGTDPVSWLVNLHVDVGGRFDAPTPIGTGQMFYNSDQYAISVWDGTQSVYAGQPWICTSSTRPTMALNGLVIYETDTELAYIRSASAWKVLSGTDLDGMTSAWVKKSVVVATTANITLSGTQTIDGVAVVTGDRVLVKDQTTVSQNGIYTVAAGAWARTSDADTAAEIAGGMTVVDSGTANGGATWATSFKTTDALGTTAMSWTRALTGSSNSFQGDVSITPASGAADGTPAILTITGAAGQFYKRYLRLQTNVGGEVMEVAGSATSFYGGTVKASYDFWQATGANLTAYADTGAQSSFRASRASTSAADAHVIEWGTRTGGIDAINGYATMEGDMSPLGMSCPVDGSAASVTSRSTHAPCRAGSWPMAMPCAHPTQPVLRPLRWMRLVCRSR